MIAVTAPPLPPPVPPFPRRRVAPLRRGEDVSVHAGQRDRREGGAPPDLGGARLVLKKERRRSGRRSGEGGARVVLKCVPSCSEDHPLLLRSFSAPSPLLLRSFSSRARIPSLPWSEVRVLNSELPWSEVRVPSFRAFRGPRSVFRASELPWSSEVRVPSFRASELPWSVEKEGAPAPFRGVVPEVCRECPSGGRQTQPVSLASVVLYHQHAPHPCLS